MILEISSGNDVQTLAEALLKIADTQNTQQSEWSVNGAAFIVIALCGFIIFGGVFSLLVRSMLNQQKQLTLKFLNSTDLLQKFQESFDKNTQILNQVSNFLQAIEISNREEAKRETTPDQLHCIVKETLNAYKFKVSVEVAKIIDVNNIADKNKTRVKIENLLKNLNARCIQSFNTFNYKGIKVGDIVKDNDWKVSQYGLIYDYIYTEGNRDLNKFYNDLDILFDSIFNEIRKRVDF